METNTTLKDLATASDPEAYIEDLYERDEVLEAVRNSVVARGMPDISVAPAYGRLLTLLVRISGARRVLEIGTLGGYSAICLARGLDKGGKVVSLELDPNWAQLARSNLEMAGLADRVEVRVGEALGHLKRLEEAGERFDLFFIDADKGNYPDYLEYAIRLGAPGSLIVADNVFLRGKTYKSEHNGPSALSLRRFNRMIATDPRLESTILPGCDGLAIARIRE